MEGGTMNTRVIRRALRTSWSEMEQHPVILISLYIVLSAMTLSAYIFRTGAAPLWAALVGFVATSFFLYLFVRIAAGFARSRSRIENGIVVGKFLLYLLFVGLIVAGGAWITESISSPVSALTPTALSVSMPTFSEMVIQGSLYSVGYWISLALTLLLFMGAYILPVEERLRSAPPSSVSIFFRRPVEVGTVFLASVLLVYLPIALVALPFLILESPLLTALGAEIPVSVFLLMLGATVGGALSIRFPAAYYEEVRSQTEKVN